ncbi:MAG: hypothetical protein ABEH43_04875, partial [Flavobacteriales bacterium]
SELLNTGDISKTKGEIKTTISPKFGRNFGMVVRAGLNKRFSIETGINFIRRNYDLIFEDDSLDFKGKSDFGLVSS